MWGAPGVVGLSEPGKLAKWVKWARREMIERPMLGHTALPFPMSLDWMLIGDE